MFSLLVYLRGQGVPSHGSCLLSCAALHASTVHSADSQGKQLGQHNGKYFTKELILPQCIQPTTKLCSFLPHVKQTFHIEHVAKWALSFANSIVQLHLKSCLCGVGSIAILLNKIKIFLLVKTHVLNILLQISLNTEATKDFSQHYTSCYYPNTNVRIKCSCSAISTITSPF